MKQGKIERSLGRIEGQIDSLISDVKSIRQTAGAKTETLYKRVATLEKKQFSIIAMASVSFAVVLAYIKKMFN